MQYNIAITQTCRKNWSETLELFYFASPLRLDMADCEVQVLPIVAPPSRACEKFREWCDLVGAETVKEVREVNFIGEYHHLGHCAELHPDPRALGIVRKVFNRSARLNLKILCRLPIHEGIYDQEGQSFEGSQVDLKPTDTPKNWGQQVTRTDQHFLQSFINLTQVPDEQRLRAIVITAAKFLIAGIALLHAFVTGTDRPLFGPPPLPLGEAEREALPLKERKEVWEKKREVVRQSVMAEHERKATFQDLALLAK